MSYVLFELFGKPRIMESPFDLFSDHTMFRTLDPVKVGDDIHFLVSEIEGAPFSGKSSIIIPGAFFAAVRTKTSRSFMKSDFDKESGAVIGFRNIFNRRGF